MTKTAPVLELPSTGYLRANQIIGNPKKGIPALLPICRSAWWCGVRDGRFPKGVLLGPRTRAWKVEEILSLLSQMGATEASEAGR
jgi:predicted DNA-binding transcriptional regulator AlpA